MWQPDTVMNRLQLRIRITQLRSSTHRLQWWAWGKSRGLLINWRCFHASMFHICRNWSASTAKCEGHCLSACIVGWIWSLPQGMVWVGSDPALSHSTSEPRGSIVDDGSLASTPAGIKPGCAFAALNIKILMVKVNNNIYFLYKIPHFYPLCGTYWYVLWQSKA